MVIIKGAFHPGQVGLFVLSAIAGVVTNAYSVHYIRRSFNLRRPSFLLIFLDALSSLICSVLSVLIALILWFETNQVVCSMLFLGIYIPSVVGPLLTAEVASLRYICLRLIRKNISLDDNYVCLISLLGLVLLIIYILSFLLIHHWLKAPFSLVTEVCLQGNLSRPLHPATALASIAPTLIFPLISLLFDALIVQLLNKGVAPLNQCRQEAAIPIRATVLSALTLIPYLVIGGLLSNSGWSKTTAATCLVLIALTMNALRCSVTTFVTFSYKKQKEATEKNHSRALRIQREIEYAQMTKAFRKEQNKDQTNETETRSVDSGENQRPDSAQNNQSGEGIFHVFDPNKSVLNDTFVSSG